MARRKGEKIDVDVGVERAEYLAEMFDDVLAEKVNDAEYNLGRRQ
jgi:hypothetical protein